MNNYSCNFVVVHGSHPAAERDAFVASSVCGICVPREISGGLTVIKGAAEAAPDVTLPTRNPDESDAAFIARLETAAASVLVGNAPRKLLATDKDTITQLMQTPSWITKTSA